MKSNGLKQEHGRAKHNSVTAKAKSLILIQLNREGEGRVRRGKKLGVCLKREENQEILCREGKS